MLEDYRDGIGPMLLDPVWEGVDDPIERIFALLAKYRELIVETDCPTAARSAASRSSCTSPIRSCASAWPRISTPGPTRSAPASSRRGTASRRRATSRSLAEFTLTVMEGAVMQARTYRDVAYFDRAIAQIRLFYESLMQGRKS